MAVNSSQWYITAILLFASAVLAGIVVVFNIADFKRDEWFQACLMVLPFVIVAAAAAGATKLGRIVGSCTWLGGLLPVGALYLIGYIGYRDGIQHRAWTGAALSIGLAVLAAFPAAIIGSFVGLVVGRAVSKSGTKSDSNQIRKAL